MRERGHRACRIPRADVASLERQLAKARFLLVADRYESGVTYVASSSITALFEDKSGKLVWAMDTCFSAPGALLQLAEQIDRVLGAAAPIGVEERPRRDAD